MAGFASFDDIINAVSAQNRMQRLVLQKVVPSTNVAAVWHTLWKATGIPAAGSSPTNGLAGAVTPTSATTGAMPFTNASGGRTMALLGGTVIGLAAGGTLVIVDRLAHANLDRNQATGSFSPVLDATSRLASGEGGRLVMEVTTQLGTTATTRTFTYTDQGGASGTTPNITDLASAVVGRVPYAAAQGGLFCPLADGDVGVRTVTDTTLGTTGQAVGAYDLSIVRVLATVAVPIGSTAYDFDLALQIPTLPRIFDDSCLTAYFISPVASATWSWQVELRIAEN